MFLWGSSMSLIARLLVRCISRCIELLMSVRLDRMWVSLLNLFLSVGSVVISVVEQGRDLMPLVVSGLLRVYVCSSCRVRTGWILSVCRCRCRVLRRTGCDGV